LCEGASFHPHQSHAENQLPHFHKSHSALPLAPPTPKYPLHPTGTTHVTHFKDGRRHWYPGLFSSLAHLLCLPCLYVFVFSFWAFTYKLRSF
jgi:hypothetical protein